MKNKKRETSQVGKSSPFITDNFKWIKMREVKNMDKVLKLGAQEKRAPGVQLSGWSLALPTIAYVILSRSLQTHSLGFLTSSKQELA